MALGPVALSVSWGWPQLSTMPVGLQNTEIYCLGVGSQKARIKVLAGPCSSFSCWGWGGASVLGL